MKSLKYVIISLLILSIFKRTVPNQEEAIATNSPSVETPLKNVKHSDREAETKKQHKKRYRSTVKKYNPDKKIATVNNVYVGVYEHNQATTPPNITIPAMVPFGTISEKHTPKEKQLLGGKINITTLWGIPVYGHRKPVKETEQNFTIGYLWLNQDSICGIAQMNDGKTFVGVIDDHLPNYITKEKISHKKTGFIWDWYTQDDIKDLQEKYGIPAPSADTVKELGIAKINRQRYKLYGIELPEIQTHDKKINITPFNQTNNDATIFNRIINKSPLFQKYNTSTSDLNNPLILSLLANQWNRFK